MKLALIVFCISCTDGEHNFVNCVCLFWLPRPTNSSGLSIVDPSSFPQQLICVPKKEHLVLWCCSGQLEQHHILKKHHLANRRSFRIGLNNGIFSKQEVWWVELLLYSSLHINISDSGMTDPQSLSYTNAAGSEGTLTYTEHILYGHSRLSSGRYFKI